MYISRNEIARLIQETPTDFIIPSYREKWEGICAIASYHIPLTTAQQSLVASVHAHANHRKNQQNQNQLSLPGSFPDSTIKRNPEYED